MANSRAAPRIAEIQDGSIAEFLYGCERNDRISATTVSVFLGSAKKR
jgi:hypothetical protein